MSALSKLGRAACAYAEAFNWAVFPLKPRDKTPITSNGFKDATTDRAIIERWWKRTPNANVGMACGDPSGGVFAIDVDPRNDGDWSWATLCAEHPLLPDTPTAVTGGGGQHVLFWGPARCSVLVPGVDVKGSGGYIVLAPSIHPSGGHYEWDAVARPDELAIAEAPGWLLDMCDTRRPRTYYQHKSSVNPDSFALGAAFKAQGWLGPEVRPGVFAVVCPRSTLHTTGHDFDTSTVIFAPVPGGREGAFHCSHSHCKGYR